MLIEYDVVLSSEQKRIRAEYQRARNWKNLMFSLGRHTWPETLIMEMRDILVPLIHDNNYPEAADFVKLLHNKRLLWRYGPNGQDSTKPD